MFWTLFWATLTGLGFGVATAWWNIAKKWEKVCLDWRDTATNATNFSGRLVKDNIEMLEHLKKVDPEYAAQFRERVLQRHRIEDQWKN